MAGRIEPLTQTNIKMKVHQKPLLLLLMMLFICLYALSVSGQISGKPDTTSKKTRPSAKLPVTVQQLEEQQATAIVEQLLAKAGEKNYQRLGTGGAWAIRKTGQNLKFFQIILSYRAGTLTAEVTVMKADTIRVNDVAPELLRLSHRLEFAKVGLNRFGDLVVRNEARLKSLDVDELTNNLEKIAAAADQTFVEVQKLR